MINEGLTSTNGASHTTNYVRVSVVNLYHLQRKEEVLLGVLNRPSNKDPRTASFVAQRLRVCCACACPCCRPPVPCSTTDLQEVKKKGKQGRGTNNASLQ